MENISQEILMKASMLQQQSQELEQQLEFVNKQILELDDFSLSLKHLIGTDEKEMLSSIGKGVYLKTNLADKQLFVEVGAGIVLRKTPQETRKIIDDQIRRFIEMRTQLEAQLSLYHASLSSLIAEIEQDRKAK